MNKCEVCYWWFRQGRDMGQCRVDGPKGIDKSGNDIYPRTRLDKARCMRYWPKLSVEEIPHAPPE